MSKPIALLTDFGADSHYVGQMKGKILGIHPGATVIDITHSIAPQDLCGASFVLADSLSAFPPGTIFIAVVDPGVGTQRGILIAELEEKYVVLPDNGLLQECRHRFQIRNVVQVQTSCFDNVSATFHGRDLMAPIAAQLLTGKLPVDFGHPVDPSELAILQLARPVKQLDSVWGEILLVDRFGNLISNIDSSLIPVSPAACTVVVGEQEIQGISYTYSDLPPGKLMCLTGSNQRLEVAVNCGNASQQLNLHQGAPIKVNW